MSPPLESGTALPPDRGHLSTEQRHAASHQLDDEGVRGCVDLIVQDHRRVADAVAGAADAIAAFVNPLVEPMRTGGRLIYVGAGTSGRLGVLDASECPPTFQADPDQVIGLIAGGERALRCSSESREDDPDGSAEELASLHLTTNDTLLGIAAGGTTPYVLGAIRLAKSAGASTGLLTCVQPKSTPAGCDHLIVLDTGPELLTGSTRLKAGSATKLALNIISTTLFVRLGKVYSNLMVDLKATNDKLTDRAIRILIELDPALSRDEAAAALRDADGKVKTALAMRRLSVDADTANMLIEKFHGRLRAIFEQDVTVG